MSEVWFVDTVFSSGVTQWQNQRGCLAKEQSCLCLPDRNPTLNRVWKLKLKCFTKWQEVCSCSFSLCLFYMTSPNLDAGAISGYQESTRKQIRFYVQRNRIRRGQKLICLQLFKECFIHLPMGPEGKGFGQEWPFFLGKWYIHDNESKERQTRPWSFLNSWSVKTQGF